MTFYTTAIRTTPKDHYSDSRRTLRALLASGLGVLPLCELFSDFGWLLEIWLAMAITVAPAALLRRRRRPKVYQTWVGLALVVVWLTALYVPQHAWGGLLPTTATWHDVSRLMSSVHDTTSNGVAPVHTTVAIKFVLAAMLALLAALVDLIAVVGRRGALAGVPLLVVYTVSGAVPRHPVSWLLFLGAAGGFLLLLSLDAEDDVRRWGRLIPRAGESRSAAGLGVSGPRIAAIALVAAVVLPFLAPSRPANLIANALHNGKTSADGSGGGFGASGGVTLDPFSALKGDLQRSKAVKLFTVTVAGKPAAAPFYLRANVLTSYSDRGWSAFRHGGTESVASTFFATTPPVASGSTTVNFTARLHILALADNPPVFGRPTAVQGLDGDAQWSRNDQLLLGPRVHHGQDITEAIAQPAPTRSDLEAAPDDVPSDVVASLQVPTTMPKFVSDLVKRITGQQTTPYGKARALSDYFTNASNGFVYSLTTKGGDSGSDLVDFLINKAGYCQQYAAAMGIMLRMAGVPARVVLGYTHPAANENGSFTVTTDDAHAWVEAYFTGVGWIPFDPTPLAGVNGGAQANLPWAPHPTNTAASGPGAPVVSTSARRAPGESVAPSQAAGSTTPHSGVSGLTSIGWVLGAIIVLALLLFLPAFARWRRRRRRLRAARRGDPDPLWSELSDTAVDLGYVWSPARSPRQVAGWLGGHVDAPAGQSLRTLATAVERARYAPGDPDATPSLVGDLLTVEAQLRAERSRSVRIGARLLPASLGWRPWRLAVRGRRRH